MAKIFRLHNGASDTLRGWDNSVKIGTNAIDNIPDPNGATNKKEITSIPSPFARIDLVKNAFRIVSDGNLSGNTIYHKMVSDTLDVGQIFFNIEKYRDFVDIITWDKRTSLGKLVGSHSIEHKRLGKTYSTYLEQDNDEYNFSLANCIYLLNYKSPTAPATMNIIGATSPATIFFSSANDLSFVGEGRDAIRFGNDKPFDGEYMPLYARDHEYIKYWWSLMKAIPNFPRLFPEVNNYLEKTYQFIDDIQLRQELQNISANSYNNYQDISIVPESQNYLSIINDVKLKCKCSLTAFESDFTISSTKPHPNDGDKLPLVLPTGTFTNPLMYVIDTWDKNTTVPYVDDRPLDQRTLPADGTKYPYLTVSDFLEDKIVRIPHKMNTADFISGAVDGDLKYSFLLPLKPAFFDYFSTSDLNSLVGGNKMFTLERLTGDAVKVSLWIPIKGGSIKMERKYYKSATTDISQNKGAVVDCDFTIAMYPSIKYQDSVKPYYRICVLDRDTVATGKSNNCRLSFFNDENKQVNIDSIVERNRTSGGSICDGLKVDSATYSLSSTYQYMRVNAKDNSFSAVVAPLFRTCNGNHKFRFAVDFGTTNTHIEYSIDGSPAKPFDINSQDIQLQKLHDVDDDFELKIVLDSDFLPDTIGGNSLHKFPIRTVISESNNTDWSTPVISMANVNIPFTYEKENKLSYNDIHTNLKWSPEENDRKRAIKYIECLLIMIRNKVLLCRGDLSRTEIVWFYPASMIKGRFDKFEKAWKDMFRSIISAPEENLISLSESVAPYYFHRARHGATSNVVSIDIGGGTTDVLFVQHGEEKYLTSFRFAANTIYGDGYSYDSDSNAIVQKYVSDVKSLLERNNQTKLIQVLDSVCDKKESADIMAFMFSLATNSDIVGNDGRPVIDVGDMLSNDQRGKYPVLIFYVGVIYHIAMLMKAKEMPMPRHMTFSGNGSKMLNILSSSNSSYEKLTKLIFERVYGSAYPEDGLTIIRPQDSKASTCKGGIIVEPFKSQDYDSIKEKKIIMSGFQSGHFVTSENRYSGITNEDITSVVAEVKEFINFIFSLNQSFSYHDEFDIDQSIMGSVQNLCLRDIKTYLENGISLKRKTVEKEGSEDKIEETLFFYPIIGIINALTREIYNL